MTSKPRTGRRKNARPLYQVEYDAITRALADVRLHEGIAAGARQRMGEEILRACEGGASRRAIAQHLGFTHQHIAQLALQAEKRRS